MTLLRALLSAAVVLALTHSLPAADAKDKDKAPSGPVSYYKDVRRVFQQHCQGCHQPARPMGGYVMTAHAELLKSGDRGQPGVVAGKPDGSVLVELITPKKGKHSMPKGKPALSASEIALIRRWIEEGATDDTPRTAIDTINEKYPPVYKLPPVVTSIDYSPKGDLIRLSRGADPQGGRLGNRGAVRRPGGARAVAGILARRQEPGRRRRLAGPLRRGAGVGCREEEAAVFRLRHV